MRIWKNKGSKRLLLCYPRRSRTAFMEYYTAFKNKFPKEVKKMNKIPYFETKVVKVKKEKSHGVCRCCGQIIPGKPIKPKKGNWVNGENLDKIKFPCFCTFKLFKNHPTHYGILYQLGISYDLYNINNQNEKMSCASGDDLERFILDWDIHILKGKIIIFEEEE